MAPAGETLQDFAARRQRVALALEGLLPHAERLDPPTARQLRAAVQRAREGRFVLLLLGGFSSGKSTLLNALLGQPVLPAKVNPCTAILTEVVFGEQPQVVLHTRRQEPRVLSVEAFAREYQLETPQADQAGRELDDRFGEVERAQVQFPLPLLANGVVLLDTPGLDDDALRTARTLASLPDADAVIVVLTAARFLTELERRTLQRDLDPLGLTNLFFPVTMVDLLDALSQDPRGDLAALVERGREVLGPLCHHEGQDRFDERFFPLDSRRALAARWDRARSQRRVPPDEPALLQSGLAAFERSLERFLVEERGRAQLAQLRHLLGRVEGALYAREALEAATAEATLGELEARLKTIEPRLKELEAIARRVARTVDRAAARIEQSLWQDLRSVVAQAEADLPAAVETFDLGSLAGLDLLHPLGRERVEARLREAIDRWLGERIRGWQDQVRPKLEVALRDLTAELSADAADFHQVAEQIAAEFTGEAFRVPAGESEGGTAPLPPPLERWLSAAAGAVLLSPGAVVAGWNEGFEGFAKGAAARLGVRLALLGLGALLGPVGWAGATLYLLSDGVLLGLTGGRQLRLLRTQVAEKLEGQLVAAVDAQQQEIRTRVGEALRPLREALGQAARQEAADLRARMQATALEHHRTQEERAARAAAWRDCRQAWESARAALE